MNIIRSTCLGVIILLSGCAAKPQKPIDLNHGFWNNADKKIGISMTEIPEPNVYLPGAGCLLCMAVAEGAHSTLSDHVDTLKPEGVDELGEQMAGRLSDNGVDIKILENSLDLDRLKKNRSDVPNAARHDFSPYAGEGQDLTHLLVIDVKRLGVHRQYSGYVPTEDPKAVFEADAYLVDLASNIYESYAPVAVYRSAEGGWDEPPSFPGLTNAYYQVLEEGKEKLYSAISEQPASPASASSSAATGGSAEPLTDDESSGKARSAGDVDAKASENPGVTKE